MQLFRPFLGLLLVLPLATAQAELTPLVVDFEDLTVPPSGFYNGADGAGGFESRGAFFNNNFTDFGDGLTAWSGWAYSNLGDTTIPGFGNQYSSFAGGGFGGSDNFAVAFAGSQVDPPPGSVTSYINLPELSQPVAQMDVWITNTTYAAISMRDGDDFSKQFGGASGNDPDYFLLTITGYSADNATGSVLGSVDFYLADFRFDDNYIIDEWTLVDLSSLIGASSLGFSLDSSDRSTFGDITFINTPGYFALDNLTITPVPEPSSLALVILGGAGLLAWRRGRTARRLAATTNDVIWGARG